MKHALNGAMAFFCERPKKWSSPILFERKVLEFTHQPQVFVSRDEYGVTHILRTVLYDERGGKRSASSHGDDSVSTVGTAYICDHVFCFPESITSVFWPETADSPNKAW